MCSILSFKDNIFIYLESWFHLSKVSCIYKIVHAMLVSVSIWNIWQQDFSPFFRVEEVSKIFVTAISSANSIMFLLLPAIFCVLPQHLFIRGDWHSIHYQVYMNLFYLCVLQSPILAINFFSESCGITSVYKRLKVYA